jgi:hypothetical protein
VLEVVALSWICTVSPRYLLEPELASMFIPAILSYMILLTNPKIRVTVMWRWSAHWRLLLWL